jgi:catechol 2,3-dioxygenase-like lactoylglutathione lyase family enzyme
MIAHHHLENNVIMQSELSEFAFHHVGVSVPDLEASTAWYKRVLGFDVLRRILIDSIPAKVVFLRRGTMHVELFEVSGAKAPSGDRSEPDSDLRTHGNKHVAFVVRDVHAFAEELRQRGADIVSVNDFPFGSNAFVRDNSGNLIEFVQSEV